MQGRENSTNALGSSETLGGAAGCIDGDGNKRGAGKVDEVRNPGNG